ncbi:MAG: arylsulfatase [Candidatus Hinthialibacter antarcticus]|nr:arylsulfatase [Candidatus Hinthialibacter antarcticus]
MKRRAFIKQTGLAATALAMPSLTQAAPSKQPNIIYIMADDLGYGDLSCFGQKHFTTPNLDRMAKEGMKFTAHYAGSTVCAPSRCSLMTGLHTGHTFIRGNKEIQPEGQYPIPQNTFTVAELMKQAGYTTGIIGKWGLGGPGSSGVPTKQGFDYWFGYLCQREAHSFTPSHLWRNEEKVELDSKTYSHDLFADDSLRFIRENKDNPFFLYLPFTIPHAEMHAPKDAMEPFADQFDETPFKGQGNYRAQQKPKAAFAAMVKRLDSDVGRILDLLNELKIADNTLVVFTSDNGPHQEGGHDPEFFDSNGPLRGIKRDLYEGGIRVPTLAYWPGTIQPGSVSDHPSAFWDFLPTCAELADVEAPDGIDGVSFAPTLLGDPAQQKTHEFLYWEFHVSGGKGIKQAARMGKWKAVRNRPDQPLELYDLETDLDESANIAQQHPGIIQKFEAYLKTARTESDIFPLKI